LSLLFDWAEQRVHVDPQRIGNSPSLGNDKDQFWESLLIAHLQGLQLFVAHPQLCCKSCATQSFVFSSLTQACSKHLEWRLLISHIA
jgi:hypothetical protein